MKSKVIKPKEKREYLPPKITEIKIDKDISLVMMSANPGGDPPEDSMQPDHFNLNPFKIFKF